MATNSKAPVKKATSKTPKDAIAILRADHKKVSDLFAEFENSRSTSKKKSLVGTICAELSAHAGIEEEIFYPAVKVALKDKSLIPEAVVEHATLKDLIRQIKGVEPKGEMYDAKVKVLAEYVKHHVKEEQTKMFPRVKKTKLDLLELGQQMAARKSELLAANV